MELGQGHAEPARVAADIVERDEAVEAVEGGVLEALGGHRPRDLLKAHHEVEPLAALGLARALGGVEREHPLQPVVDGGVGRGHLAPRGGDRPAHVLTVPVRDALGGHVRAIHREGRDDLAERAREGAQREVARGAVLLGDRVQAMRERVELGGHRGLHDEPLAVVHDLGEAGAVADEARVVLLHGARLRAIDEDTVQQVQELVAGGAGGGPRLRQLLARRQDLLGHDVDLAARARLEPPEIVGGVVEPVGVIDAQPGHRSLAHEAEEQAVGRLEHLRLLHPDGGQLVDVEEAPVVDLLAGDAPVGGAVRLVGEQRVQRLHALGVAGLAVEEPDVVLDEGAHRGRRRQQRDQLLTADLLFAPARGHARGILVRVRRQRREPRDERLQRDDVGVLGAQRGGEDVDAVAQDPGPRARRDRQHGVEVADEEAPVLEAQLQLAAVEHGAVLVAEHGQQDLVGELGLHGPPVDVEGRGVGRGGAVFEHVQPPRVAVLRDAHVVGDDVDEQAHVAGAQRGREPLEGGLPTQLVAQAVVVGDVVAVRALRGRLEERRAVGVADAQRVEIVDERRRVVEGQAGAELQAIRRARDANHAVPAASTRKPRTAPSGASRARASPCRVQISKNRFCAAQRP